VRASEEVQAQLKSEALNVGLEVKASRTMYTKVIRNLNKLRQNLNVDTLFWKVLECLNI
jgi:hypothetical protein